MWGLPRGRIPPLLKGDRFGTGDSFLRSCIAQHRAAVCYFGPGKGSCHGWQRGSAVWGCGAAPQLGGEFPSAEVGSAGTRRDIARREAGTSCSAPCSCPSLCSLPPHHPHPMSPSSFLCVLLFSFIFLFIITNREHKLSSLKVRKDPTVPGARQHPERHLPEWKIFAQSVKLIRGRAEAHQRKPQRAHLKVFICGAEPEEEPGTHKATRASPGARGGTLG